MKRSHVSTPEARRRARARETKGRAALAPHERKATTVDIPQAALRDAEHRARLAHHTITAAVLGDPLPGYSQLDKRGGVACR